ncbi:hypothetical protein [Sinorhizobium meliloti]|nr:hypothetical protein [Sinorhizobium meliloti]MDX0315155.1 hypothetical protein [Sinorhizobium meliloti]
MDAGELAYAQLESRLSRSGVKETTLDYAKDFAERRGIAEAFGVKSEIELAPAQKLSQDITSRLGHPGQEQQDRPSERQHVYEERAGDLAGPVGGREDPRQPTYSREAIESLHLDQPPRRPEHAIAPPGHSAGRETSAESREAEAQHVRRPQAQCGP